MRRVLKHRTWLLFAAVAGPTLGACSSASSSGGDTAQRGRAARTGSSAGASIDACRLLNQSEIQQQLGVAVDEGKLQTTQSQASCDWTAAGVGAGLTVRVQDFDQNLWNTFTSSSRAKPVSGLGDAAFANVPIKDGLMIKQGKYEIDVGVVDFKMSDDRATAAAQALAALVVPRVAGSAHR